MNYSYAYVLEMKFPERKTSIYGNSYNDIKWVDGLPPIPDQDIERADAELFLLNYLLQRQGAYDKAGINSLTKSDALWDRIMNNDTKASDALQVQIDQINQQFPPPR